MSQHINTSPSKKLRSLKRLMTFIKYKSTYVLKPLSMSHQDSISISPSKPTLGVRIQSINIPPVISKRANLDCVRLKQISISPRPIYHPAIINACSAMFAKHPSSLSQEEVQKFKAYRSHKIQKSEPIESEIIYLPSGGIRNCLNCGELT